MMIMLIKSIVGAFVLAFIALIFVYYLWTKCKNDDFNAFLNKAIGVFIGVAVLALGIWLFS